MSASLFSSFLVFLATGALAFVSMTDAAPAFFAFLGMQQPSSGIIGVHNWLNQFQDPWIEAFLFLSILANALYFYYYAALAEMYDATARTLAGLPSRLEWLVRVGNQTLFLFIWLAITASGLTFAIYMIALYLTFILWDSLTRKALRPPDPMNPKKKQNLGSPLGYDRAGLFASAVLLAIVFAFPSVGPHPPTLLYVALGGAAMGYLFIAFMAIRDGVREVGFNPFEKKYWRRPLLR